MLKICSVFYTTYLIPNTTFNTNNLKYPDMKKHFPLILFGIIVFVVVLIELIYVFINLSKL